MILIAKPTSMLGMSYAYVIGQNQKILLAYRYTNKGQMLIASRSLIYDWHIPESDFPGGLNSPHAAKLYTLYSYRRSVPPPPDYSGNDAALQSASSTSSENDIADETEKSGD